MDNLSDVAKALLKDSPPARLLCRESIEDFCRYFIQHGALGGGGDFKLFTEAQKLSFLPMVFGYMPVAAVEGRKYDQLLKPIIRQHLISLGVDPSDELVSVVKSISDQFWKSSQPLHQRKKHSIGDLRARSGLYKKILFRQNGRCVICGVNFERESSETLDHIVPYKLIGDVLNGANWQVLCSRCNNGKGAYLSVFQMPEFFNWQYNGLSDRAGLSNLLRYAVLIRDGACGVKGCMKTAREAQLNVIRVYKFGLIVLDNLGVACEHHSDEIL